MENDYQKLAEAIFPEIKETVADLEKKYPPRKLESGAMVTRFAPSPTGFLHTGSLFTALISWKMAKQSNGVFFIRLEDTDQKREVAGSGEELISQLKVFGVIPDEGYLGSYESGSYGPYIQSNRSLIYKTVIKEMIAKNLVYPCFCSPEELDAMRIRQEAAKVNTGYYGEYAKCRYLTPAEAIKKIQNKEPYVLRFRSHGNSANKIEVDDLIRGHLELTQNDQDIVVLKSDGLPTYHFAHLVDDHFMRTTNIIRGEEWLSSLPIHIELYEAMGWGRLQYAHLPVIMKLDNGNRRKLSKRKDPEASVAYFLEQGYPTESFLEYLLTVANSNYEEWRMNNRSQDKFHFQLTFDKMSVDGALFDLAKIKSLSKEWLAHLNKETFTKNAYAWAKVYNSELKELIDRNPDYFKNIINIEREKDNPRKDYEKYSDIVAIISFFYDDYYTKLVGEPLPFSETMDPKNIIRVLQEYSKVLNLEVDEEQWFSELKVVSEKCGYCPNVKEYKKNPGAYFGHVGDVSEMIRVAIAARKNTPNLYYVLKILGKEKVLNRFALVINILNK